MSEARNLVHLPLYAEEPALREYPNCRWCSWHVHGDYNGQLRMLYYDWCRHPILTGNGTGFLPCDSKRANEMGACKHYEPTRLTRLLRWTRLGRKAIMVPND